MSDFEPGAGWREVDPEGVGRRELHLTDPETGRVVRSWVREALVPPLPTDPGYYVAEADAPGAHTVVELLNSPAGQWVDSGDRRYVDPDVVRALGSLVRLEPRAVTAEAVIDRVRELLRINYKTPIALEQTLRDFGAAGA